MIRKKIFLGFGIEYGDRGRNFENSARTLKKSLTFLLGSIMAFNTFYLSQIVESLVQRNQTLNSGLDGALLGPLTASAVLSSLSPVCIAHQHVELRDLVGILTRSRHLDGPSPVEIAVAQGECQLLDLKLLQRALIQRDEAVSGEDAALVSGGWRDEEVERLLVIFITTLLD